MAVTDLRRVEESGVPPLVSTRRRHVLGRLKPGWRRAVIAVVLIFTLGFGYFFFTFLQVWTAARRDGARPAQAVVVLGAAQYDGRPSAVLRARLDHAADLYKAGIAPLVVVTGGRAKGDRFSEASASASYLHTKGVPDEAILREVDGRSSWESLAASARFLKRKGITDVVLVSDPFHAARIRAMAKELGLHAATSPTRTSPIKGLAELKRMAGETMKVGLGRIFGFRRLMAANEAGKTALGVPAKSALHPHRAIL